MIRKIILTSLVFCWVIFGQLVAQDNKPIEPQLLKVAISKGIEFLAKQQLNYGEFKTCVSMDRTLKGDCFFVSTPVASAFILYSLSFVEDTIAAKITKKGVNFFIDEMDKDGLWSFYSSRNNWVKPGKTENPPYLSATAVISFILMKLVPL